VLVNYKHCEIGYFCSWVSYFERSFFFGSMTQERKTETKRERLAASSYFTNIFKSRHSTLTSQRR